MTFSIRLYPSLYLFKSTTISIRYDLIVALQLARLTDLADDFEFTFTPRCIYWMFNHPKHKNETCYRLDF